MVVIELRNTLKRMRVAGLTFRCLVLLLIGQISTRCIVGCLARVERLQKAAEGGWGLSDHQKYMRC